MRRATSSVLLGLAGLLSPGVARATHFVAPPADELWDGEVRVDASADLDRQTPPGAQAPLDRTASLAPRLTGSYFLHPLVDEEEGALGLIEFYQHPGALSLTVGTLDTFSDLPAGWSGERRGLTLDARGEGYPWHESGLVASAGASFSGVNGTERSSTAARYGAGFIHYFRPGLRAELLYLGSVEQVSRAVQSPQAPALQDLEGASNTGRVSGEAVLLDDRLSVQVQLDLGQFTQDRTAVAFTGGTLPGDYTSGLLFGVESTVTGYFGRRFSAGLRGGLTGRSSTTTPDSGSLGVSSSNTLTPYAGPVLQYFFLDSLSLRAEYQLAFPRTRSVGAPEADVLGQALGLAVAGRL